MQLIEPQTRCKYVKIYTTNVTFTYAKAWRYCARGCDIRPKRNKHRPAISKPILSKLTHFLGFPKTRAEFRRLHIS